MNKDFTFNTNTTLIIALQRKGYSFITFLEYIMQEYNERFVIVRHDIERKIENALGIAEIENKLGIKSSYYFRYANNTIDKTIIKKIKNFGHEIGYHYETLVKARGNYSKAIEIFEYEINELREIADIKTISAHGSPLSKWNSKKIWEKYNFDKFGILGEPYFSIDFNEVLYLTDTGRRWDGESVNVRDKVNSKFNHKFKSTFDIIRALNNDKLPNKVMINVHPHRWADKLFPWLKELIYQNAKNIAKHVLVKKNR